MDTLLTPPPQPWGAGQLGTRASPPFPELPWPCGALDGLALPALPGLTPSTPESGFSWLLNEGTDNMGQGPR